MWVPDEYLRSHLQPKYWRLYKRGFLLGYAAGACLLLAVVLWLISEFVANEAASKFLGVLGIILFLFGFPFFFFIYDFTVKRPLESRLKELRLKARKGVPKVGQLEKRLAVAKSLIEADRERKKFLKENDIAEDSDLGQQINMVFSEYEARLKDPEE